MAGVNSYRAAGIIHVKVDGDIIPARGKFTFKLSGEKKELECNADGTPYITGKAEAGFIKGSISNVSAVDLEKLRSAEGVLVTLDLGNGKTIEAEDAVQVDAMEGDSETGEVPIEWRSARVEELR